MSNDSEIRIDIVVDNSKATADIKSFGNAVESAGTRGAKSMESFRTETASSEITLGSIARKAAAATLTFVGFQQSIQAVWNEFKFGLSAIEDFNVSIASSAAFIATFSEKTKSGDLAGGFSEASAYAEQLALKLEMVDSQTIASGKDLQVMSETMIQHGVLLDINNKKQVEGFTNIATALALVTQGQNKDIQMRQEINALLTGQVRMTDRLPQLLSAIDPLLVDHIEQWKREGTLIENIGELLKGFSASAGDLDDLWITIGSTMDTIHRRVLRGAMKPIFDDLLGTAKEINSSLMDAEGNLTPLAEQIQGDIVGAYTTVKDLVKEYGGNIAELAGYLVTAKTAQLLLNAAVNANPYVVVAGSIAVINRQLVQFSSSLGIAKENSLALTSLDDKYRAMTVTFKNLVDVLTGVRNWKTGALNLVNNGDIADTEQYTAALKELGTEVDSIFSKFSKTSSIAVPTISSLGAEDLKLQLKLLDEYKQKTKEQEATTTEMYQTLGLNAEEYFANEATKLVDKAAKWEKAGGDIYTIEQWLYTELGKLSDEAYEKQEFAAGKAMDDIQAMYRTVVDQFNEANSSLNDIFSAMGINIDEINKKDITIKAYFDGSDVVTGINELIQQFAYLKSAAANVPAVTSTGTQNTNTQTGNSGSTTTNSGPTTTNTNTYNFNQELSRSDIQSIISEQARQASRL